MMHTTLLSALSFILLFVFVHPLQYSLDDTWQQQGGVFTEYMCDNETTPGLNFTTVYFNGIQNRFLTTPNVSYVGGGAISWKLFYSTAETCGDPIGTSQVVFEYRTSRTASWTRYLLLEPSVYSKHPFISQTFRIPTEACTDSAEFRWRQENQVETGTNWAIADVTIDLSVFVQPVSEEVVFFDDFSGAGASLFPMRWSSIPSANHVNPVRNVEMSSERDLDIFPTCAGDSDCTFHQWCNLTLARCVNKINVGGECTSDEYCQGGMCVDGVCCNELCDGECVACNVAGHLGFCTAVPRGMVDSDHVCTASLTACGLTGFCSGFGSCEYISVCGAESCATETKTYTPAVQCADAATTCGVAPAAASCASYADSDECADFYGSMSDTCFEELKANLPLCETTTGVYGDMCEGDEDCAVGFCRGGCCIPKKVDGSACGLDEQCSSGFCVTGVCCSTICNSTCEICNKPGSLGTCTPSPNYVVHADCPEGVSCGNTGMCVDNKCQWKPSFMICAEQSCSSTSFSQALLCVNETCGGNSGASAQEKACAVYEGVVMCFNEKGHRYADTVSMDVTVGGYVRFVLRRDLSNVASMDNVKNAVDLRLFYSIDGGVNWVQMGYYFSSKRWIESWRLVEEEIPLAARTTSTMFRLEQLEPLNEEGQKWAIDNFGVFAHTGPSAGKGGLALDLSRFDVNNKQSGRNNLKLDTKNYPLLNNFDDGLTVEMWLYLSEISDVVIRKCDGNSPTPFKSTVAPDWALSVGARSTQLSGRTLQFMVTHSSPAEPVTRTRIHAADESATISFESWVHVAVTYGGGGAADFKMYLDGTEVEYEESVTSDTNTLPSSGGVRSSLGPIIIGAEDGDGKAGLFGRVDDVRIWNRVRTADEIANAMSIPASAPYWQDAGSDGLVAFWSFDADLQDGKHLAVVKDLSGHGHDARLSSVRLLVPSQIGVEQSYVTTAAGKDVVVELDGVASGKLGENSIDYAYITEFPQGKIYVAKAAVSNEIVDPLTNITTYEFSYSKGALVSSSLDLVHRTHDKERAPHVIFVTEEPGVFKFKYRTAVGLLPSASDTLVSVEGRFARKEKAKAEETPEGMSTGTIIGAAAGSVGGILLLFGVGGFVYYSRYQKEHRIPPVPVPTFTSVDAFSDKYWMTTYNEPYVESLGAIEDLLMDMRLVIALTKATQITEADELCKSLVYVYEKNHRSVDMLKVFITNEITMAHTDRTLFRGDSVASKMLKHYSKMMGMEYLYVTLSAVLNEYVFKCHKEEAKTNFEVDATRSDGDEMNSDANKYALMQLAQKVLSCILKSAPHAPVEFRIICNTLFGRVRAKWPEHAHKAIGGFLFLRFFIPAVVAPFTYGLVYERPNDSAQRMLTLLGKILLNCANDVEFGQKETYMIKMNDFLVQNRGDIRKYFETMAQLPDDYYEDALGLESTANNLPPGVYQLAMVNVHRALDTYHSKCLVFLSDQSLTAADYANGVEPGLPEKATESLRNGLSMCLKMLPKSPALPKQPKKLEKEVTLAWTSSTALTRSTKTYSTAGLGYVSGSGYETKFDGDLEPTMKSTKAKAGFDTADTSTSGMSGTDSTGSAAGEETLETHQEEGDYSML